MTNPNMADLIDQLGAAALDCRAAITEARQVTKDLRQATREAKELADRLIAAKVEASVDAALKPLLAEMSDKINVAQQAAAEKVEAQLDELVEIMLGKPGTPDDLRPAMMLRGTCYGR